MAADEDELRTELARPSSRHAATDAEGLGLVGGGEHDPAADGDGLAAERGVEQLLNRGIEGVEVRVEDGGHRFHSDRPPVAFQTENIKRTFLSVVKRERRGIVSAEQGALCGQFTLTAAGTAVTDSR